MKVRCRRLQRN